MQEHAGEHLVDRALPFGIGEHYVRVLPTEFDRHLGDVLGGDLGDGGAGRQSPGERDEVDVGRVGQRSPQRRATALDQVDHRRGHPGFFEQMDEGDRGQGRDFTGFGDHRATRTEGGRHLPGHLQQRIVPRRDQHAYADGFAYNAADDCGVADVDEPIRFDGDEPRVVPENRCDVVDVDAALDQSLAGVPGFQLREGFLVSLQQIGDAAEQRGTFCHRCGGPIAVVERLSRRGDGIARVLRCGLVDDRGDASVGGVDDLARPPVGRMPPHTADQEIGFTIHIWFTSLAGDLKHRVGTLPTRGTRRRVVRQVDFSTGTREKGLLGIGCEPHRLVGLCQCDRRTTPPSPLRSSRRPATRPPTPVR